MKERVCSTCEQRRWAPRLFREHVQERLVGVRLQGACCPARREEEFDNEVEHVLEKGHVLGRHADHNNDVHLVLAPCNGLLVMDYA